MIYIVVLNWNSDRDTIKCIKSLLQLNSVHEFKIIICDNDSKKESAQAIENYLNTEFINKFIILNEQDTNVCQISDEKIIFIKNKKNYGYAGGNNVGLKLAMMQEDMRYCWVLNNDTEVDQNALQALVDKMLTNTKIGICGSRLVEMENRKSVQALGGVINPWFCITKEIGSEFTINDKIDEAEWEEKIDFVVGASLFFSKVCLEKVGLLCEDYFLYYEEIDYCNRVKDFGLNIGIASKSIVYHEQGVSTGTGSSKSDIADFCQVRNRVLIAKKFYKKNIYIVKLSFLFVIFNRLSRKQFNRAYSYLAFLFI